MGTEENSTTKTKRSNSYIISKNFVNEGKNKKALALIEQLPPQETLRGLGIKSIILFTRAQFQNALELATDVFQKSKQVNDRVNALGCLWTIVFSTINGEV